MTEETEYIKEISDFTSIRTWKIYKIYKAAIIIQMRNVPHKLRHLQLVSVGSTICEHYGTIVGVTLLKEVRHWGWCLIVYSPA